MMTLRPSRTAHDILHTLAFIRFEAGQPEIGTREVELVKGDRMVWTHLKQLRAAGKIHRRGGWVWITEPAFREFCEAEGWK